MVDSPAGTPPSTDPTRARRTAERLERDALAYPGEWGEIMIEAAGEWSRAGDHDRALEIYDELIASEYEEDVQSAMAEKISLFGQLGRDDDVQAQMEALKERKPRRDPAAQVAEFLEERGRLEDALTWFNLACGDVDPEAVKPGITYLRPELLGRSRVRKALGLPPDDLDRRAETSDREFATILNRGEQAAERPAAHGIGTFFVRTDVKRAFEEKLVHIDDPDDHDVDSYFRRVERGWRNSARELGIPGFAILPMTVDDLMAYAESRGSDPRDQRTRVNHARDRAGEGAATISWPPGRNVSCWCGSGRKYKKCCGSPANQ